MPLGFERLNERHQRPNANINFIKPLETADKATAERFLQCIAAQCYPVMKKHHISVMSLEEYPSNPEFLGRNFNAGEVIQLVLKDKQGRWLSMKFVQMVMMHELAHCKQMNHSRFFWNVRNEYAAQMEDLWRQKYVGEGIWGRGRGLDNGAFVHDEGPDNTQVPEHLCGGSYRRRGRKRKRGQAGATQEPEKLSYAERQQRRIAKKFGKHGEGASVGDDELLRGALETMNGGKRGAGKPRVANSKRGRELRANAALARFEQAKVTVKAPSASDTESDCGDYSDFDEPRRINVKTEDGREFIKVCGEEGEDEQDGARDEMKDLRALGFLSSDDVKKETQIKKEPQSPGAESLSLPTLSAESSNTVPVVRTAQHGPVAEMVDENAEIESDPDEEPITSLIDTRIEVEGTNMTESSSQKVSSSTESDTPPLKAPKAGNAELDASKTFSENQSGICGVCSLENEGATPTCIACSNVLRPDLMPSHWRCQTPSCRDVGYVNAGDAGRCGICGAQKPTVEKPTVARTGRDLGLTRAEVLRWE